MFWKKGKKQAMTPAESSSTSEKKGWTKILTAEGWRRFSKKETPKK